HARSHCVNISIRWIILNNPVIPISHRMLDDNEVLPCGEVLGISCLEFVLKTTIGLNGSGLCFQLTKITVVVLAKDPDLDIRRGTHRSSGDLQFITLRNGCAARGRGEERGI